MKAIFDKNSDMVGWIDLESNHVYDCDLVWIGFVSNGYFFNTQADWIGGFAHQTFVDKSGKPVGWIEGARAQGSMALSRPIRPIIPIRPIKPLRPISPIRPIEQIIPLGGWSMYTWNEYCSNSEK